MGQYCFAGWRLSLYIVVCNAAVVRAGRPGMWAVGTLADSQGTWAVRRLTLHGGPVQLRPVRATLCFMLLCV